MNHRALPCALAIAFAVQASNADVLIDNMSELTQAVTVLGVKDPDNIWAAQAFSVPGEFTLDSISLFLGDQTPGNDPVAQLREGKAPDGPVIATFKLSSLEPAGMAEVTLIPDVAVTLIAGTKYWIVLGTQTAGSFGWAYAQGNIWKGPGTIEAYAYSEDQGVTWGGEGFDNPYHFRVVGTPVSESCPADFNGDGTVNSTDVSDFINAWFQDQVEGTLVTDWDDNGVVNSTDVSEFINAWFEDIAAGCGS